MWDRDGGGSDDGSEDLYNDTSSISTLGDRAEFTKALKTINRLTNRLENLEGVVESLVDSLGKKFTRQDALLHDLQGRYEDGFDDYFEGAAGAGAPGFDRKSIVDQVLADITHAQAQYALQSEMSRYVTHAELADFNYVSHRELEALDYVDGARLNDAVPPPTILPPRLEARINELEGDMYGPAGAFVQMEQRYREMEDRKLETAVSVGGYTFKDSSSVSAWVAAFGDPELFRFCVDFKSQLAGCADEHFTMHEGLQNEAAAIKAGYNSKKAAAMALTFGQKYIDTIFRHSTSPKDAARGGFVFQPAFSSFDVFEGDLEHSTKQEMLDTLEVNRGRHQEAIDGRFPPDQPQQAKAHAVFSAILRRGYFQATGFINSISPFYRMMIGATIPGDEAWDVKTLTYSKAVFENVETVRTVSSERTAASMILGMMRATDLLDSYQKVGWLRHPDVNLALVLSALQDKGRKPSDPEKKFTSELKQIKDNKKQLDKHDKMWKKLEAKKPELFA